MSHLRFATLTILAASTAALAQQQPDCRTVTGPVGTTCVFTGTDLPVQKYLGDISLPPSFDHVHMTGPLVSEPVAPAPLRRPFVIGILGGVQAETFGAFDSGVRRSAGVKAYIRFPLTPRFSIDVRGTSIYWASTNHTEAIEAGPRFQQKIGPLMVYAETLAGAGYEYYWGLPVSAVVGTSIRLGQSHFWLVPIDGTYRYFAAQPSSRDANPRKGRIEAFAGLEYHFRQGRS